MTPEIRAISLHNDRKTLWGALALTTQCADAMRKMINRARDAGVIPAPDKHRWTVGDFLDLMAANQPQSIQDLYAMGRGSTFGPGRAAGVIRFMARMGQPFPWATEHGEWLEGHTKLGHTGMSTAPLPADRIGRLKTIRDNIKRLEEEIASQRALHRKLADELLQEVVAERDELKESAA